MNLPPNFDSIDLAILQAIARKPNITTREIEGIIYLSRSQVIRRLDWLQEQGLVCRKNGVPGQTYRYELSSGITPTDIQEANAEKLLNHDPIAREALGVLLQGMQALIVQLTEMTTRLENILK